MFDYHMNLHYSQTKGNVKHIKDKFDYHMNLHYSQTSVWNGLKEYMFDYHMNLHYSQTGNIKEKFNASLTII